MHLNFHQNAGIIADAYHVSIPHLTDGIAAANLFMQDPRDRTVEKLLARFPGPVVLYPSRSRGQLMLAGFIAFFCIGLFDAAVLHAAVGWLGISMGGLGIVVTAAYMLPGANALKLDHDGFEVTEWFRRGKIPWQDATDFTIRPVTTTLTIVIFNYTKRKRSRVQSFMDRAVTQGRNASFGDNYGLRASQLALLMIKWRERVLGGG
jgi:hypothetical protein